MKKLPAQFDHTYWNESELEQELMYNAVTIYEYVKNNPGIELLDGTDYSTALILRAKELLRNSGRKWYITGDFS